MSRRVDSQSQHTGRFQQRGCVRPQATGKVYALIRSEAASLGNLIITSCLVFGKPCDVLFDSGATHSFVSEACVEKLGLSMGELEFDMVVSTPTTGLVRTSTVCSRCPVEVDGRRFQVNLVCLPLQRLKVILGMNWLSTNRILIDCGEKKLLFPEVKESTLLSWGKFGKS
ncbi:uncharacterized protein LOC106766338 [Vigna radiata var. radiata]|uniref:Uncharacterized protein LOC106766338 n=1 Tax=Vigna radiata var. radiata TaxID=3916 RepID=A0A1S3UKJ6_VIGRR|nr:uncharacterized protein LOC106766338 [Vigna radiata var. radiata]